MRRIIFFFSLLVLLILSGCSKSVKRENPSVDEKSPLSQKQPEIKASAKVDYIDFEAEVISSTNFNDLNANFDGMLDKTANEQTTQILLTANNHRSDLTVFDYKKISTLDGVPAQDWQQISERMGGHHVSGVLTFPKVENPRVLIITDLPVSDAVLIF
jgi:hypothetical protein